MRIIVEVAPERPFGKGLHLNLADEVVDYVNDGDSRITTTKGVRHGVYQNKVPAKTL